MKPRTKKILKWTGIILGALLVIILAIGLYIYSLIPKYEGKCPPLQSELFTKPRTEIPMQGKYIYKSATELAAMIKNHEATSVEIVSELLANIRNNNYKYNAMVWLRENEALEEAKKADEAVVRGDSLPPLHGVPFTVKEMYWVKGLTNNMNAKMMGGFIAPEDGEIVKQIKKSGAILLGTTNVPYLLGDYQVYGDIYPTGNNPYDTSRTPGGSSGGSAAALAAGFTPLEVGSDLGGSISVPASFCGVYGLKTTFGTVNITEGTGPDTITKYTRFALAVPGPMARTAEDLEIMWKAMRDTKPDARFQHTTVWKPASDKTLAQYRVAWTDEWKHGDKTIESGSDVREKLQLFIDSLNRHGAFTEKKIPDTYEEMQTSFFRAYALMFGENQPWIMRQLINMDFQKFSDGGVDSKSFTEAINHADNAHWKQWLEDYQHLKGEWEAFFKQYDFVVCPVTYGPAIHKCPTATPVEIDGKTIPYTTYLVPFSTVFNALGSPSVVVPMGLDNDGLPIGLQIIGPYYSEPELLHFAKLLTPLVPGFVKPKSL